MPMNELMVMQRNSRPVGMSQTRDQIQSKLGFGMHAGPAVPDFAINDWHLFQREFMDIDPVVTQSRLMKVPNCRMRLFYHNSTRFMRRRLFDIEQIESNGTCR